MGSPIENLMYIQITIITKIIHTQIRSSLIWVLRYIGPGRRQDRSGRADDVDITHQHQTRDKKDDVTYKKGCWRKIQTVGTTREDEETLTGKKWS